MEDYEKVKVFICDPEKNEKCDKTLCQTQCFYTDKQEFAKDAERK